MSASDAKHYPIKNQAYRFTFDAWKSVLGVSSLNTGGTGADSQLSADAAVFSPATNEATEIGSSGIFYIDFTASEMNHDTVVYKCTFTNSGSLDVVQIFYPQEAGDLVIDNASIASDVWDEPIASHLTANSVGDVLNNASEITPQDVWEYSTRTLTVPVISPTPDDAGGSDNLLIAVKASSFSTTLTGLDLSDLDILWFTVKQNTQMSDLYSIIQVANPGGIIYLNGRTAETPTDARLTVVGSTVTIEIDVDATAKLPVTVQGVWDLKKLTNAGIATVLASGFIQIKPTVTLAY